MSTAWWLSENDFVTGNDPTRLTHVDAKGEARMVDVGHKSATQRTAVARALVLADARTVAAIRAGSLGKGDVLAVARVAGIMAAKRTAELIPLCHPIALSSVEVRIELDDGGRVTVETVARTVGQTGVEMEALTAAAVAALTIYDMCKAIDRGMTIGQVQLLSKAGGKSGEWRRDAE